MEISDEWRAAMRQRMAELDMTHEALAEKLGCRAANVTQMLRPLAEGGYRSSAFAPEAARIVGVPLPETEKRRARLALLERLEYLSQPVFEERMEGIRRSIAQLEHELAREKRRNKRR